MDEYYIQEVLNGNTEAFKFIIRNHKDMAFSLAFSIVRNEYLAQEVLQSSFVIAYIKLSTFKGKSKFGTWLYRIVVNESFKALNKKTSKLVYQENIKENAIPPVDSFLSKISLDEQKYFINEALKKLPTNECLALRLFYLNENSIEEIGDITGWSASNIKVILHRARNRMRETLKQFDINEQIINKQ
jgi:RNA polymerase sigma-70 factor (ECF subfamily)